MVIIPEVNRRSALAFALLCLIANPLKALAQSGDGQSQTKDGLIAYIGVVPAAIVKGQASGNSSPMMHAGIPRGRHEIHLVVAVFEANDGARVSDASVTAQVSALALGGPTKPMEAMDIAGTVTYGGFFDMSGAELYTVRLTIRRPGIPSPVVMDLSYDHRL